MAEQLQEWSPPNQELRRAGVSSFGFGGVDAHLILEEYVPDPTRKIEKISSTLPFLLSAESQESLNNLIQLWQKYVKSREYSRLSLETISYILTQTRAHFRYKWGQPVEKKNSSVVLNHPRGHRSSSHSWAAPGISLLSLWADTLNQPSNEETNFKRQKKFGTPLPLSCFAPKIRHPLFACSMKS